MIILIEIMKDKWKNLSELDIVTGLDMGWCSELLLLVLHNSYLYQTTSCFCTTTKKKYKPRSNKQISVSYTEKKTPKSQKLVSCMCGCWSIFQVQSCSPFSVSCSVSIFHMWDQWVTVCCRVLSHVIAPLKLLLISKSFINVCLKGTWQYTNFEKKFIKN